MRIAYLCNSFPEASEAYVAEEIAALQREGASITPCSVYRSNGRPEKMPSGIVTLFPLRPSICIAETWLLLRRFMRIRRLLLRAIRGPEPVMRRLRTIADTLLGAN